MKSNIALIGFMGTGKTAVGKLLAAKMHRKFIELDAVIEQKAGKPIPDIFQRDGEIAFRELEIAAAKDIAKEDHVVVACGGGLVLNKINIDRLKEGAVIVLLTASPEAVLSRTAVDKTTRPLLDVPEMAPRIRELMAFRKPFYERAADIKINTSKLNIEAVVRRIIKKLEKDESFNF
ncbi:MAG: shikimate kinase [Chloroflexota bacterium]